MNIFALFCFPSITESAPRSQWGNPGLVNGKGGEQRACLATVQEEPLLIPGGIAVKMVNILHSSGREMLLKWNEMQQEKRKEGSKAVGEWKTEIDSDNVF